MDSKQSKRRGTPGSVGGEDTSNKTSLWALCFLKLKVIVIYHMYI